MSLIERPQRHTIEWHNPTANRAISNVDRQSVLTPVFLAEDNFQSKSSEKSRRAQDQTEYQKRIEELRELKRQGLLPKAGYLKERAELKEQFGINRGR